MGAHILPVRSVVKGGSFIFFQDNHHRHLSHSSTVALSEISSSNPRQKLCKTSSIAVDKVSSSCHWLYSPISHTIEPRPVLKKCFPNFEHLNQKKLLKSGQLASRTWFVFKFTLIIVRQCKESQEVRDKGKGYSKTQRKLHLCGKNPSLQGCQESGKPLGKDSPPLASLLPLSLLSVFSRIHLSPNPFPYFTDNNKERALGA